MYRWTTLVAASAASLVIRFGIVIVSAWQLARSWDNSSVLLETRVLAAAVALDTAVAGVHTMRLFFIIANRDTMKELLVTDPPTYLSTTTGRHPKATVGSSGPAVLRGHLLAPKDRGSPVTDAATSGASSSTATASPSYSPPSTGDVHLERGGGCNGIMPLPARMMRAVGVLPTGTLAASVGDTSSTADVGSSSASADARRRQLGILDDGDVVGRRSAVGIMPMIAGAEAADAVGDPELTLLRPGGV